MNRTWIAGSLLAVTACAHEVQETGVRLVVEPGTEGGMLVVVAQRLGAPTGAVSVDYATSDMTAIAGQDYTAASGTLTWADGDGADQTISIPLANDLALEGEETFAIALSNPVGTTLAGDPALATVRDDDRIGNSFALTSTGRLVSFDRDNASVLTHATRPEGLAAGEAIVAIDIRPRDGMLYALTDTARLYMLAPGSGALTSIGTLRADPGDASEPFAGLVGTRFEIDFNPVPDRLRIVSDAGQNLRVDVDTGNTFTDASIRGAATGLAAAGYTNNFADACRTRLFAIDPATDRLLLQDPPNDGTTSVIGSLGVDASSAVLDVITDGTGTSEAFAVLATDTQGFYKVDLATGTAFRRGDLPLDAGEQVRGLALVTPFAINKIPQAPGELFAATDDNRLVSFNRAALAKPCTSSPIANLAAGDQVVDIDTRPSTGVLYALANRGGVGTLYELDPMTAIAANPVALTQTLVGTSFGIDFNPTGPVALRIVSDAGQNLRVTNVQTGATAVDGNLNGASTGAGAAGYTNSIAGAGTTTLFTIDPVADRLRIQNPPNSGAQVDVGALGVDATAIAGFDVDGRDNIAFVALDLANSISTTFHTLDLATGAVSPSLGAIGGGLRVRGLTRATPTTTVFALLEPNVLATISLADPTPAAIGPVTGLLGGEALLGIDVRPSTGILYGLSNQGRVYAIDPATGAATLASTLAADATDTTSPFGALSGLDFGVDFNPTGPVALRVTSDAEQNLRIPNVLTGATFTDGAIATPPRGYALTSVAYTNSVPGATATTLYGIDPATRKLVAIVPPNNGAIREIATVPDFGAEVGFDIIGASTAVVASAPAGGPTTVTSLDLTTGAATSTGTIRVPEFSFGAALGLAAEPSPTPAPDGLVYAIDASNRLVRFPRNNPDGAVFVGQVFLGFATEVVAGLDFRPSTGELWMLTRDSQNGAGRLYTMDSLVPSGVVSVTLRSTLAADAADTTAPYARLEGQRFGVDFNPTGPVALRIVSDTGQNLRVPNPLAGNTFTDAVVNTPVPDATAAAYTNSFAGATTTTLHVIDVASGQLMIQNPPNNGTLTPVGALSPTLSFAGLSSFDIGGGANGLALAALQRAGVAETFSRLYRVDLATGAVTELGNGIGAGAPVRGLAIRIR